MSHLVTMLGVIVTLILTCFVFLLAIAGNIITSAILGLIFGRSTDAS